VQRYGDTLQSTVLVAPHHGSLTSSTWPFIKKVKPGYVLFPTGYLNRYHFPNNQVLKRYQSLNSTVFNTASDGAILLRMDRDFPETIQTWRQSNKKIWTHLATE
jgi:competence protein ComEC